MQNALLKVLLNSRFIIIIAVIASIIAALAMIVAGTMSIVWSLFQLPTFFTSHYEAGIHPMEVHIISGIDAYLVATVLIVFAIGLYELFIYPVSSDHQAPVAARALVVNSIDQLKEKISKLVIMVLVVLFFKQALLLKYNSPLDLLYLSGGILLAALALYFGHGRSSNKASLWQADGS